jgi:hypothetical protein
VRLLPAALLVAAAAAPTTLFAQHVQATYVDAAPVIDGRTSDSAWIGVRASSDFTVFRPSEGGAPTYRTEVRAAYNDRALYILVRAHDPRPDSIIGLLSRRDNFGPPNDLIQLYIDSYHDGRTGFEYVVNPAGVKSDFLLFDDDRFDLSWDGIWDVATRVDSLGWVAEFAIPFSQLRFRGNRQDSFGIMVWRTIGRLGERSSLPAYRPSRTGMVSQLGTLGGLTKLPSATRLEVAPYALARTRNMRPLASAPVELRSTATAGADVKFGPAPSVTLDATFNPDFGQVESDPAVLNLSSIETFLPERRPFFLEGIGLFRFTLSRDPNSPEGLFYTRRIGRRPFLIDAYGDAESSTETTIIGAGKLTARLRGNMSLASLAAVTAAEEGALSTSGDRYVVEPRTVYSVTRVQRDFRAGRSSTGLMLTGVSRDLDGLTENFLARQAVTGGLLSSHQSRDGRYLLRAWAAATDVRGDASAITRLQLSPVHAFQRPDDGLALDTLRTQLTGTAWQVFVGKTGGVVRYGTSYRYISPGFENQDLGYIREADHKSFTMDVGLQSVRASRWYRNAGAQVVSVTWWSGSGRIDQQIRLNGNAELPSQWRVNLNGFINNLWGSVCAQACTRGGPAIRKDATTDVNVQLTGDTRARVSTDLIVGMRRDDGGRSSGFYAFPSLVARASSNLIVSTGITIDETRNDIQFYRRFGAAASDTSHYTLARLEQGTRALTTRVSYAATKALSVEWYAQPYIARGTWSNVRELNEPRADDYDRRLRPYFDPAVTSAPGGTDFRQFRSNLVSRWEYRPGSVLYVVWSQGRDLSGTTPGTLDLGRDARGLFAVQPRNIIAVKASYWLSATR